MKLAILILVLTLAVVISTPAAEKQVLDIQYVKTLEFESSQDKPADTWDFCQIDNGKFFIIPDYRIGDVKVFEASDGKLKLRERIGKKGYGKEDGFQRPTFCSFSRERLAVVDAGIKKIFIYKREGGLVDFSRDVEKEISCWAHPYGIRLEGDQLLVSGYTENNGEPFSFYSINIQNTSGEVSFLLPSYIKYDFKPGDFETQYKEHNVAAIGRRGPFAVSDTGNDVYFAWEGDLNITKIHLPSQSIDPMKFQRVYQKKSEKPNGLTALQNYARPYVSSDSELVMGYRKGDFEIIKKARKELSLVRNLFATEKHLLVIYEGPDRKKSGPSYFLQFYSLYDGRLKKEIKIDGSLDQRMSFDSEKKVLYTLLGGADEADYSIKVHQIID